MNLKLSHIFRFLLIDFALCGIVIVVLSFFYEQNEPPFFVWIAPIFVAFVHVIKNTFMYVILHVLKWNNRILGSWGRSVVYAAMPLVILLIGLCFASAFEPLINSGFYFPLCNIIPFLVAILDQLWYRKRKQKEVENEDY